MEKGFYKNHPQLIDLNIMQVASEQITCEKPNDKEYRIIPYFLTHSHPPEVSTINLWYLFFFQFMVSLYRFFLLHLAIVNLFVNLYV